MATAVLTRHSLRAERPLPARRSPFRSQNPSKRFIAALVMIQKREAERDALIRAIEEAPNRKTRNRLRTRLRATKASLASWERYYDGTNEADESCYREPRAVIIASTRKEHLT